VFGLCFNLRKTKFNTRKPDFVPRNYDVTSAQLNLGGKIFQEELELE